MKKLKMNQVVINTIILNSNILYQLTQLTNSINQVVVILAGTKMWLGLRLDGLEVWPQRQIVVNSKHLPWLFVH